MLIVCADDFGQSSTISQGILKLVTNNRLQAVSCMVTEPACQEYAKDLLAYQSDVEIGLHLNLTHMKSSLVKVIAQSYRLWPCCRAKLKQNIREQLECFHQIFNKWPDFIDGHQHVHQLPLVSDVLFEIVQDLGICPWFRRTYVWGCFSLWHIKKLALCVLGGHRFSKRLEELSYASNLNFAGDYHFSSAVDYRQIFLGALKHVQGNGLIMCHPGLAADDLSDPISRIRGLELDYFSSDLYLQDLARVPILIAKS